MTDNPNMKNDLSKRRCRYRIVLEGQTEEQTTKPEKTPCTDPGIVSGSPGLYGGGQMVNLRKTIVFQISERVLRFQWGELFFWGGGGVWGSICKFQ